MIVRYVISFVFFLLFCMCCHQCTTNMTYLPYVSFYTTIFEQFEILFNVMFQIYFFQKGFGFLKRFKHICTSVCCDLLMFVVIGDNTCLQFKSFSLVCMFENVCFYIICCNWYRYDSSCIYLLFALFFLC